MACTQIKFLIRGGYRPFQISLDLGLGYFHLRAAPIQKQIFPSVISYFSLASYLNWSKWAENGEYFIKFTISPLSSSFVRIV